MSQVDAVIADYLATDPANKLERSKLLRRGGVRDRFRLCWRLAMLLDEQKESRNARLLMDRAFDLWRDEPGFIDQYLQRLRAECDVDRLRLATKRAGMLELGKGNLLAAIRYFNLNQYAASATGGGDSYQYDSEIMAALDIYPQSTSPGCVENVRRNKPRIAYLVFGAGHDNSVLIRLLVDFARNHDYSKFDIKYFSCDIDSQYRQVSVAEFSALGVELVASDSTEDEFCLFEAEARLKTFAPDIVVGIAVIADYRNYYLFSRFPEVKRVVLCYGPPAQYVPPSADFAIGATWHPILDCPVDGAVVEIEATLPVRPSQARDLPEELRSVPANAVVVMAAGRSEKFADIGYWSALVAVLEARPDVYFVVIGLARCPQFLEDVISATSAGERIITVGWVGNYHDFLRRADIVVDTFPSGGGLTVMDAMAFGIPVVSFEDDYLLPFDQANWNLGEELLPTPELIVPRDNLGELTRLVTMLVDNRELRKSHGEAGRSHAERTRSHPERMVRRIEDLYLGVLRRPRSQTRPSGRAPFCLVCSAGFLSVAVSRIRRDFVRLKRLIAKLR